MLRQIEWRLQNGPYRKEWSFTSNYLIFWRIFSSLRTFEKELDVPVTQMSISVFFVSAGV